MFEVNVTLRRIKEIILYKKRVMSFYAQKFGKKDYKKQRQHTYVCVSKDIYMYNIYEQVL